jgi:spermidine/putrescine transport system permease protein
MSSGGLGLPVPPADARADGSPPPGAAGPAQYAASYRRSCSAGCSSSPLALIIAYSFWRTVDYNVVHDWTLDNYHYFLSVSTYLTTFWATIWVSISATAITILIAFLHLLARPLHATGSRPAARARDPAVLTSTCCASTPGSTSSATVARSTGCSSGCVTDKPVSLFLYDRPAVILVLVYLYFPFAALTLYASLERFDWNQSRRR